MKFLLEMRYEQTLTKLISSTKMEQEDDFCENLLEKTVEFLLFLPFFHLDIGFTGF